MERERALVADVRQLVDAAERAVLGSILTLPDSMAEATACLKGSHFREPVHEKVFNAATAVHAQGVRPVLTTVHGELERRGEMRGNLTVPYLAGLGSEACSCEQIPAHARIIVSERRREKLDVLLQSNLRMVRETDRSDFGEIVETGIAGFKALTEEFGESDGPRKLLLTPASKIRVRPVRWIWDTTPEGAPPTSEGRIPMNSLCIAAGGPGLGKSQFAAWMAARITTGTLPGALYGSPRSVIYAATEDSWSYTIAPRLMAAGADLDRVFRIDVTDDDEPQARLTLPVDIDLLGETAEAYSVALLVADPLLSLIDDSINDYRQKEVRKALEPLAAAADRHHFTVFGLAHFTKAGGADPLARISGSGAFGQLVRSSLAFAKHEGENGDPEYVVSLVKNNLGRENLPSYSYTIQPVTIQTDEGPSYVSRFVLGDEATTSVAEVMRAEGQSGGERSETNETVLWLQGLMQDNGGSERLSEIKKFAKKEGISDAALYRAKDKLKIRSKVTGFGHNKGAMWYLPEAWDGSDEG